ncbi:hypothetical protein QGN23_13410 [Chryseobacterium gotjawalense]|uniref:Addiction module component CHP02574 family protein n=1 Tax=Chryseobacterium gotjawalense TaxID=3042315 RepID=A0ABY8RC20_9FLAO|nr:hypothetical protein [Chryseobacterium sp. wdc7]WHF51406.1 hypothetical protein QGN23_13410 [Chryseobacterium sp. wdc7]
MNLQYINDSQGNPTGVFIPIEDWKKLEKKYQINDNSDLFQLSDLQKKNLAERIKSDKKDFIPARKALDKLRQKHGL